LDYVDQIIVSENSLSRDSEGVSREFPSLPIRYLRQDPPIPAAQHFTALIDLVTTFYVAILHDDDWWLPHHLEYSIEALERTRAVASFSNFFETVSPRHPVRTSHKALRVWAVAGQDFSKKSLLLTAEQNFLIHLLSTSVHYSTYVGRTSECALTARQLLEIGNDYDNDRNFPILLGEHGRLVYMTGFAACIRIHEGQDCARDIFVNGAERYALNTARLAEAFPLLTNQARSLYNESVRIGLSSLDLLGLEHSIAFEQKRALASLGFMIGQSTSDSEGVLKRKARRLKNIMHRVLKHVFRR
jgi:hypothetical protein